MIDGLGERFFVRSTQRGLSLLVELTSAAYTEWCISIDSAVTKVWRRHR